MKKIMLCLSLILLLSGCWNYKELNDYSIVTGIAIDKNEDEYEASILISNSTKNNSNGGDSQSQIVVYSGTGDTIVKALKEAGLISPKELYLRSFSVLIISEDVAKDDIMKPIDFFLRYSNDRNNFDIVISKDVKAKDTLKIMSSLSSFPSQSIADNLDSTTKLQGIVAKIDFNDLLSILLRDGIDPTINAITIKGDIEEGAKKENIETSLPKSYIKVEPLGIFKNNKLVYWTTHEESLGINMVNNNIDEMYLKVEYNNGYIVVDTTNFSAKMKALLSNNKPIIDLNVKGEARIIEVSGDINLEDSNTIEVLQKEANKLIKKKINKAFDVAKKYESDIFGFGLKFSQDYPKYFNKVKRNWNNEFKNIKLNIKSNLIFKYKASAKNSMEETYDKKKNN